MNRQLFVLLLVAAQLVPALGCSDRWSSKKCSKKVRSLHTTACAHALRTICGSKSMPAPP